MADFNASIRMAKLGLEPVLKKKLHKAGRVEAIGMEASAKIERSGATAGS